TRRSSAPLRMSTVPARPERTVAATTASGAYSARIVDGATRGLTLTVRCSSRFDVEIPAVVPVLGLMKTVPVLGGSESDPRRTWIPSEPVVLRLVGEEVSAGSRRPTHL